MKKLVSITVAVIFMLNMATAVLAVEAQVAKTDTAPVIDGKMDDIWKNANAHKMSNYIVAVHDNEKLDPKKSAADFSGEWRALWDDDNFYLLVDITDPQRISINVDSGRNEKHYDDSANVYITPNLETAYTQALLHITSGSNDLWHGPPNWAQLTNAESVKHAIRDYGDGYMIEMAFPWDQVGEGGMTPAEGASLLLDVHAVDNDLGEERSSIGTEGRYPQSKITWSDLENKAYENNENLGKVTLVAAGDAKEPAPSMPQTGMGGTEQSPIMTWIVLGIVALAFVFIRMRRGSRR